MQDDSDARVFYACCFAVALGLIGVCVWLAWNEYFFGEDFLFLSQARAPESWAHVFVPLRHRTWWSYRPLSIEVYYSALHAIAGLNAFPYLLVSLVGHFAAGLLVYRLARQLDFDRRVALFAAVLSVGMYPSLFRELFWTSSFQLVAGRFFYLLTLTLFIDYLQRGRVVYQVAACASVVLTLLSNELGMTLPGPLVLLAFFFRGGPLPERIRAALKAAAPGIAIVLLYLPFRYLLLGPSYFKTPALYAPHLGWNVVRNVLGFLSFLTKTSPFLGAVMMLAVALGWFAAARQGRAGIALLGSRFLLLAGWMLAAMVPFIAVYFIHHRAGIIMEAPFCLLIGAHLDAIARAAAGRLPRRLTEAAMVGLLLISVPYAALRAQATSPRGAVNRDLLALLERAAPPVGACIRLETRAGDAWSAGDLSALGFRTGGLIGLTYPGRFLELPGPPGKPAQRRTDCTRIVTIEVGHGAPDTIPNYELRLADPQPSS